MVGIFHSLKWFSIFAMFYPFQANAYSLVENPDLLSTALVLVSTMDGSIRGVDRYKGIVYWTLQGGPGNSAIKSSIHFNTHKEQHPSQKERDIFSDVLQDASYVGDTHLEKSTRDEHDIYYIVEPHDGGGLYIYGDGRPLQVRIFLLKHAWPTKCIGLGLTLFLIFTRNFHSR
jgi:hypothetical protein